LIDIDHDTLKLYDQYVSQAEKEYKLDDPQKSIDIASDEHVSTFTFGKSPFDSLKIDPKFEKVRSKWRSGISGKEASGSSGRLLDKIADKYYTKYEEQQVQKGLPVSFTEQEFATFFKDQSRTEHNPITVEKQEELIDKSIDGLWSNYQGDKGVKVSRQIRGMKGAQNRLRALLKENPQDSATIQALLDPSKKRIEEFEKELYKKPEVIAPDSLAIQKRAGQILLSEEIGKDVAKMPADEIDYYRSLPDAEKFVDKEDLPNDTVGKYVSTLFKGERRPWSEMNASVTKDFNGANINKARSMIASRMIRAYRQDVQPAEEVKEKVLNKQAKNLVKLTKPKTVKAPPPILHKDVPPTMENLYLEDLYMKDQSRIPEGTLLKLKPKYKYGYKVSYQNGNPTFKLIVDGSEKAMTDETQKEAMGLYEKELNK